MHHELKILPGFFQPVLDGSKTFEIRDNSDRNFQEGDTVTLNELDHEGYYTGRCAKRQITFVTDYAQKQGYVVFGMKPTDEQEKSQLINAYLATCITGYSRYQHEVFLVKKMSRSAIEMIEKSMRLTYAKPGNEFQLATIVPIGQMTEEDLQG